MSRLRLAAVAVALSAALLSGARARAQSPGDAPADAGSEGDDGADASTSTDLVHDVHGRIKLEAGTEYDSNIHRLELPEGTDAEVVAAPLLRAAARAQTAARVRRRGQLRLAGVVGGKLFLTDAGRSENVGIVSVDGRFQHTLPGRSAMLSVRGAGYDSFNLDPSSNSGAEAGRNFAIATGELGATVLGPKHHRLTLTAGYRDFTYKPDHDFDWDGDHYGLRYRTALWRGDPDRDLDAASIEVDVGYEVGRRHYAGRAFTSNCPEGMDPDPMCIVPTGLDRIDLVHTARAEVLYTGDRVWTGAYELSLVDSNSFGQSLVRHRIDLGVTTKTWAEVFLTARATVIVSSFLDPLLLARDVQSQTFISIDDENRNALSVHLARDLGASWTIEARYAIFTNEFATKALSFRRQIGYVGMTHAL